ncbi:MAG: hypothetical protein ABWY06_01290 [Pseudomonas sp.]|uniref:hypothetical protein n=1 Tax=Pseudomonas sp. TaxID=306 RepID=UPI003390D3C2
MAQRLIALCALLCSLPTQALQQRHELGLEAWGFAEPGAQGQARDNSSLSLRSEFWHDLDNGRDRLALTPFVRADARDAERSHADLREASWNHLGDGFELRAGVRQVFWGVTEGVHLVDIINQTDQVESLDGEQKLGQPMLNLAIERDQQMLDLFVLVGARERTFPGEQGRLRLPLWVDEDLAHYESSRENRRLDLAARWQLNLPALRLGLSGFSGTAREPELQPVVEFDQVRLDQGRPVGFAPGYQPVLAPYYPLINQLGLDLQVTQGDLLWKLEAIQRNGGRENFNAADAGLEYTQVGAFGSGLDLGWLLEYLHDSRGERASGPFEHDLLLGWRVAFNDAASSSLLTSLILDRDSGERLFSIEAQHRLDEDLSLELEVRAVAGGRQRPQDPVEFLLEPDLEHKLRPLLQDDFVRLELSWFF